MNGKHRLKGVLIPRLIDAGQEIDDNPDDAIQYQHGLFCQLSLPRSKTDALTYERHYAARGLRSARAACGTGERYVQQPLALRRTSTPHPRAHQHRSRPEAQPFDRP